MKPYTLVNDLTGEEYRVDLDPDDAEESRAFWKVLGWTLFKCEP